MDRRTRPLIEMRTRLKNVLWSAPKKGDEEDKDDDDDEYNDKDEDEDEEDERARVLRQRTPRRRRWIIAGLHGDRGGGGCHRGWIWTQMEMMTRSSIR